MYVSGVILRGFDAGDARNFVMDVSSSIGIVAISEDEQDGRTLRISR